MLSIPASLPPLGSASLKSTLAGIALATVLASGTLAATPKHLAPIPGATQAAMKSAALTSASPILVRVFKKEAELEVWKQGADGRYVLLKTFPICRWSGQLGPKRKQGDRQSPEGFYTVSRSQMNPSSAHYLAFNVGFPNAYDRSIKASGSALMVHGTCSSSGCYAMTNEGMSEIYALAREAFAGGQSAFQFHAYPFRMTAENMLHHRGDRNIAFWAMIKEGYDRFEATRREPLVSATKGRYVFLPYQDIEAETAAIARINAENVLIATLLSRGRPAYQVSYVDGGQHPSFAGKAGLGDVSRPEALSQAGVEVKGTDAATPFRMPVARQVIAARPVAAVPDVVALAIALGGKPGPAFGSPEPLAIAVSFLDPGSIRGAGSPVVETFRDVPEAALYPGYEPVSQPTISPATVAAPVVVPVAGIVAAETVADTSEKPAASAPRRF